MCLALIAIGQHPRYPLIILSNRDEFYNRATAPAHYWQEDSNLFAGKDLVGKGSWLGVTKNGAFALVTNYRNPSVYEPQMISRGLLVSNYLLKQTPGLPTNYINELAPSGDNYNQFNVLVGDINNCVYYSNVEKKVIQLTTHLYGLSNHLLDTPWYKVLRAKELFNQVREQVITCDDPERISSLLMPILEDECRAPANLLPQTGLALNLERALSSIFVSVPEHDYGTRNSTLILFEKKNIFFAEKIFLNNELMSFKSTNIEADQ